MSCFNDRAEQRWGREVRPGCAGRAKASGNTSAEALVCLIVLKLEWMAGMKSHCHSCQPDGQRSPLSLPEGIGRPSRMGKSDMQRGEVALCLGSLLQLVLGLSYKVMSLVLGTTSVLWVASFNECECLCFIYALWIRNSGCSYSRSITAFLTVTIAPLFLHRRHRICLSCCHEPNQSLLGLGETNETHLK